MRLSESKKRTKGPIRREGHEQPAPVRALEVERDRDRLEHRGAKHTSKKDLPNGKRAFELASSPLAIGGERGTRARSSSSAKVIADALEKALFGVTGAGELDDKLKVLGFDRARRQPRFGSLFTIGKPAVELRVERGKLADLDAFDLTVTGPRGGEERSVLVSGVTLERKTVRNIRDRVERTIDSFERAMKRRGGAELPATLEHLKKFLAAGETKKVRQKEREHERELARKLDEVVRALDRLRAAGIAPEGIILYVDGPDGAGKSSTGGILLEAMARAGFDTRSESFKAPTKAERKKFWLDRFARGVPKKGEAVYWDRGPAGDAAYGNPDAKKLARMAKDVEKFDADLAARGVLQFKVELYADPEKQAETMGKRLGRRAIADRIASILERRGELDDAERESLDRIRGKIDPGDFRALVHYDEIQSRFVDFAKRTGGATRWNMIDATRRHKARIELCDRFIEALEKFTAASAVNGG